MFERNKMFKNRTNKMIKRVALIAAAALAVGGISSVSANAAGPYVPGADWTISNAYTVGAPVVATTSTETASQIAGPANYVTLVPANTGATNYNGTYFTVTGGTTTTNTTSGTVIAASSVNIATPSVGTITVNSYQIINGVASTTATTTTTITVVASAPGTVYASSNVYANAGTAVGNSTTDSAFSVTQSAGTLNVANFAVSQVDANGVALTSGWKAITATSTNGILTTSAGSPAPFTSNANTTYASGTQTAVGTVDFILSGINGLAGTSTVTISVNGVVVKTYKVTFTGVATKIVVTAINPVIGVGTALALTPGITANTLAIKVQEFDASGNALMVPALTITPVMATIVLPTAVTTTSGTFADGSTASSVAVGLNLTGVAVGSTTLTVTDGTLVSSPVTIRVSSATPTSVVYTTDAPSYSVGGVGKVTVTVSDAAGTVPAGTYTLATGAATSSLALTGNVPLSLNASVTLNDMGALVSAFNAPLSTGTVKINGTATNTVTVTPVSFAVTSSAVDSAQAAADAAKEATTAANAATDAAKAAGSSADMATKAATAAGDKASAALLAVTSLSQQVTVLIAKLASITTMVSKILASINKTKKSKARR